MADFTLTDNPAALEQADEIAGRFIQAFNEACALQLYENLDASTSARTGVKYPDQPRVSSTAAQMPQEQSGGLQGMVDSGRISETAFWWGLNPKNREEAGQAEAIEKGNPRGGLIARAPTLRTGLDSRTHRRATEAGKKAIG